MEECTNSYYFIFNANKLLIKNVSEGNNIPTKQDFAEAKIDLINKQYLGLFDGIQCYCMELEAATPIPGDMSLRELRSLLSIIDNEVFLLAGRAFQIVNWYRMNKYCGKCGDITEGIENERVRKCSKCGSLFYPRISPAIIVAILKGDKILLAHNKNFKENWYSLIAGFVEPGETFEGCVKREVTEEVGVSVKNIKYYGSQPWPFPDSLMIGFTAEYDSGEIVPDGVEISDAGWFCRENLPQTPSKDSIAGELISWYIKKESSI